MKVVKLDLPDPITVSFEEWKNNVAYYMRLSGNRRQILVEEDGKIVMAIGFPPLEIVEEEGDCAHPVRTPPEQEKSE